MADLFPAFPVERPLGVVPNLPGLMEGIGEAGEQLGDSEGGLGEAGAGGSASLSRWRGVSGVCRWPMGMQSHSAAM